MQTCRVCGAEMGRVTHKHLQSDKCSTHEGRKLTMAEYRELRPEDFGPSRDRTERNGDGDSPQPRKKKDILKAIEKIDVDAIVDAIDEQLFDIEDEIAALEEKKRKLLAVKSVLTGQDNAVAASATQRLTSRLTSPPRIAPGAASNARKNYATIKSYLDAAGAASLTMIHRGTGIPTTELQQLLNGMRDAGEIRPSKDGNKYELAHMRPER